MRWCAIGCLLISMCVVVGDAGGQEHASRFPESRGGFEGDLWMNWNNTQRNMFIRGFLVGHHEGFRRGCGTAVVVTKPDTKGAGPEETPIGRCLAGEQIFRREASYYEEFVTRFYTKYPEDRDLPLRTLIEDSEEKTPEQIHEWVSKASL
jgi:hypothetical protein